MCLAIEEDGSPSQILWQISTFLDYNPLKGVGYNQFLEKTGVCPSARFSTATTTVDTHKGTEKHHFDLYFEDTSICAAAIQSKVFTK